MQNFQRLSVGSNITKLAGYALSARDRIGPVAIEFENVGKGPAQALTDHNGGQTSGTATITVKTLTGSGYTELIPAFNVKPGGRVIKTAVIHQQQIGFFGSGNTVVSVSIPHSQAHALRGAPIDIVPVGRQGFEFDTDVDRNQVFPPPLS